METFFSMIYVLVALGFIIGIPVSIYIMINMLTGIVNRLDQIERSIETLKEDK